MNFKLKKSSISSSPFEQPHHTANMRGKRSKQYRKLMQQYGQSFGFREPYQVLLDADMIKDADKFKMDLLLGLERTLHGKVKPSMWNLLLNLFTC